MINCTTDNKLIWEAYTTVYVESPDKVRDPNNSSDILFYWNSTADFNSTFMRIGEQWFLSGINVFTPDSKFFGTAKSKVHSDVFNELINIELRKLFPKLVTDYNSLNNYDRISLIMRMIRSSKILLPIYDEYDVHGYGDIFVNQILDELNSATDKEIAAFRKENGYNSIEMHTIFYEPDESETRVWFDCGRLWLNPQTIEGEIIPGIVISMWRLPTSARRTEIETKMISILKKNNIKVSRIVWDGDKDIDPKAKHTRASKLQVHNNPSWDDIKYR